MSFKVIILLAILTLCVIVVITEARDAHDRGGSLAKQAANEKFAKRRSSRRKSQHKSTGWFSWFRSSKSQKHDTTQDNHKSHTLSEYSSHSRSKPRKSYRQNSEHRHSTSHEPHQRKTQSRHTLGSSASQRETHAVGPHVSHNWSGHQLPPGHVYVTQPASIPVNAVYYAQPPTQTNTDGTYDFALGYLVGRSLTRTRHHHHHHYEKEPQAPANKEKPFVENQINEQVLPLPTDQAHYWPTDAEVALAPLNNTLIPNGLTSPEPIFKNPPIVSAQRLNAENATFELPTATAAPPTTPPTNGIICMPWSFNETDPSKPDNVVVVQKTVCFPAPPTPLAPLSTPLASKTGDIDVHTSTTTTAVST